MTILPSTKVTIAGIDFETGGIFGATKLVISFVKTRNFHHIHLANAFSISIADKNPDYRSILQQGVVFPDGKPITWFSKLFNQQPRLHQVRGPQLFLDVLDQGRESHIKHFFLGDTNETLELMRVELLNEFNDLMIVGSFSPPFRELTSLEISSQDEIIKNSQADIVWVGLGTPKQDFEASRISKELNVTAIAIGAAFGFTAKTIPPAPSWMRSVGLEWMFRLITEPKRLWRRYLFGNFRFIFSTLRRPHS